VQDARHPVEVTVVVRLEEADKAAGEEEVSPAEALEVQHLAEVEPVVQHRPR
jgi:hypothetical protein